MQSEDPNKIGIEELAEVAGLTGEGARRFVEALIEALHDGKTVVLRRLGHFQVRTIPPRKMIRPGFLPTAEAYDMPERRVARFQSSPILKRILRGLEPVRRLRKGQQP